MREDFPRVGAARVAALAIAQSVAVAVIVAVGAAPSGGAPPVAYAFALLSGVLVIVAARLPVPAVIAAIASVIGYYLLDLTPIGVCIPILGTIYLAALAGHVLAPTLGVATFVATSVVFRALEGGEAASVLASDTVTNLALAAAALALPLMQRAREAASRQQERLRELERSAAELRRDAELLAISRELHDSLGHRLTTVAVFAEVAAESSEAEARGAALRHVRDGTRSALDELRAVVRAVRRGATALPMPTVGAAVAELEIALRGAGLEVDVQIDPVADRLPPRRREAVLRVLQEAVTNVLRHSRARHVELVVAGGEGALVVRVHDDGAVTAFAPGQGIAGMRERIEELGGSLDVTGDGAGFLLEARIPDGAPR